MMPPNNLVELDPIEAAFDTRDINVIMFLDGQHSRHVLAHCRHFHPHGLHFAEQLAQIATDHPQRLQHETVRLNHQPTLPSSEIEISFCASTANSIGSCCSTSFTKPLTTRPTASS